VYPLPFNRLLTSIHLVLQEQLPCSHRQRICHLLLKYAGGPVQSVFHVARAAVAAAATAAAPRHLLLRWLLRLLRLVWRLVLWQLLLLLL